MKVVVSWQLANGIASASSGQIDRRETFARVE